MTTTTPNWDALVAERAALKANIDAAQERVAEIDNQIRDHHDYGTKTYAGLKVSIERNRRLNADRFKAAFPPAARPELYDVKVAPNMAIVKDHIAPNDLDAYYDDLMPKIMVR